MITVMPLYPVPLYSVFLFNFIKYLPEVCILDRFFVGGFPAASFPVMDPFGYAVADIIAVGKHIHGAGLFELFQRPDGGREFHTVVGGMGF